MAALLHCMYVQTDVIRNSEIMLKGMQLANEMKMRCIGTCGKSGLYMDKLLENVVRSHPIAVT